MSVPIPSLSTFAAITLSYLGLRLLLSLRIEWLHWKTQVYVIKGEYWVRATRQSQRVVDDMGQLWPADWMKWELWRWDFGRYIVHRDHWDEAVAFTDSERQRENLSLAEFYPQVAARVEEVLGGLATAQASQSVANPTAVTRASTPTPASTSAPERDHHPHTD